MSANKGVSRKNTSKSSRAVTDAKEIANKNKDLDVKNLEAQENKKSIAAQAKAKPEFMSTAIRNVFDVGLDDDFDFIASYKVLEQAANSIKSGDLSKIEDMYLCQAAALEVMFASLARQAKTQDKILPYETLLRLALKAQNQSRATLQALVQLKQPSQTTFVKQANIAQGHQQVNNLAEKNITPQNELLGVIDGNSQLDARATTTPERVNPKLETLDKINRG